MQPFALTVEGDSDTLREELRTALANVFDAQDADHDSAAVAVNLARAGAELVESDSLGDGVSRYAVTVNGAVQAGAAHSGLDSVTLSVSAITRTVTDTPSGGEPAPQV